MDVPPDGVAREGSRGRRWTTLTGVSLERIAWLVTTAGFVVAAVILLISGYQGYAGISAAVAASAAINLK